MHCATLVVCTHPAIHSLRARRTQPHAATGACRLCGSSSPCSCCPCLVQFLRVCLTVQKAHCSNVPDREDTAAVLQTDVLIYVCPSPHALPRTVITRAATPCSFFIQSSSATSYCTHPPLTSSYHTWALLCVLLQHTPFPLSILSPCIRISGPHLPSARHINTTINTTHRGVLHY